MATIINHLEETGQENDHMDLVLAREMALDQIGRHADTTASMAWNLVWGDKLAFIAEREAQRRARDDSFATRTPRTGGFFNRPKRAAADKAPEAWKDLSPRKRQRRQ
jgi:hypothetical protein